MALLSKALSAISPPKARPSMRGADAYRIKAMAGQQNEAHQIAERIDQGDDLGGQPPRERPMA